MSEPSRSHPDDASAMRVDGLANAELSRRLSEIARSVDTMRDELISVGLVVDASTGQGAPADAFRPGAWRAEQGCLRGVESVSKALAVIADNAAAGVSQVVDADRELDAQFRTSGQSAGADGRTP